MHPAFSCEDKYGARGLILVNWSTVLVGRVNNSLYHRWFYSLPSWTFATDAERDYGFPYMLTREIDADLWSGDFIPCRSLYFGFVMDNIHMKRGPLHEVDPQTTLDGLADEKYVILLAFAKPVWYALFGIVALISFLLYAVLRREEEVVHAGSEAPSWETSEVLLVTIGAICQQGSHRHPDTAAARTIFTFLYALSVIMYTAYSAAFVALLSPPVHQKRHAEVLSSFDDIRFNMRKFSVEHLASVILKSNLIVCTTKQVPPNPDCNCTLLIHDEDGDAMLEVLGQETTSEIPEVFEENQLNLAKNGEVGIVSLTMEDAYPAFVLLISGIVVAVLLLIMENVRHQQTLKNKFRVRGHKVSRKVSTFMGDLKL